MERFIDAVSLDNPVSKAIDFNYYPGMENTRIIEDAEVEDLLPGVEDIRHISGESVVNSGVLSDCGNFYASQAGDGVSLSALRVMVSIIYNQWTCLSS